MLLVSKVLTTRHRKFLNSITNFIILPKVLFIVFSLFLVSGICASQEVSSRDSLEYYLRAAKENAFTDTPKAKYLISRAESLYVSGKRNLPVHADILDWQGKINYVLGDYVESYKKAIDAYKIFEKLNDVQGMKSALKGQGLVLQAIGNHQEALVLFYKAIHMYENDDDADSEYVACLINVAISKIELGDFKVSRNCLEEALELSEEDGLTNYTHMVYNKMGIIELEEGNYEKAINNFSKVLTHAVEPNVWEKAFAYNGLGKAYMKLGNDDVALTYALKGLYYAKTMNAVWDMQQSYTVLYGIYKDKGDYKTSLNYYELATDYKDSLFNQMRLNQLDLLELKKNEEEKRRLVAENEFVSEKLVKNRVFNIFILCFSAFLVVVLAQHRRRIRRENELSKQIKLHSDEVESKNKTIQHHNTILAKHNNAKDKLISVLSHDLRSPISAMEQLLEFMVAGELSEEEKNSMLEELLIQVRSTSYMLNDLLKWAKLQLDGLEVNPVQVVLPEKVKKTINSFYLTLKRKEIAIENNIPKESLPVIFVDEAHVNIIIHNLVSNAIKYTRKGNKIVINYGLEEGYVVFSITNYGVVMKEDAIKEVMNNENMMASMEGTSGEKGEGVGLLLIKRFIKENNSELRIVPHPDFGTEFIVHFPVAAL